LVKDNAMPFPHRINSDGTIDSICDQCFVTVGTSTAEPELRELEAAHACEPARVAYYHRLDLKAKRPPADHHEHQPNHQINSAHTRR